MSPVTKERTRGRFDKCCESSTSRVRKALTPPDDGTAPPLLDSGITQEQSVVSAVIATPTALAAIRQLVGEVGPITFFLPCRRFPMCFVDTEFAASDYDVLLGLVGGCRFYLDSRQYDTWSNLQIELDVGEGPPSDFWLSAGANKHFVVRPLPIEAERSVT